MTRPPRTEEWLDHLDSEARREPPDDEDWEAKEEGEAAVKASEESEQ